MIQEGTCRFQRYPQIRPIFFGSAASKPVAADAPWWGALPQRGTHYKTRPFSYAYAVGIPASRFWIVTFEPFPSFVG